MMNREQTAGSSASTLSILSRLMTMIELGTTATAEVE
jgi:hypothetical protein